MKTMFTSTDKYRKLLVEIENRREFLNLWRNRQRVALIQSTSLVFLIAACIYWNDEILIWTPKEIDFFFFPWLVLVFWSLFFYIWVSGIDSKLESAARRVGFSVYREEGESLKDERSRVKQRVKKVILELKYNSELRSLCIEADGGNPDAVTVMHRWLAVE